MPHQHFLGGQPEGIERASQSKPALLEVTTHVCPLCNNLHSSALYNVVLGKPSCRSNVSEIKQICDWTSQNELFQVLFIEMLLQECAAVLFPNTHYSNHSHCLVVIATWLLHCVHCFSVMLMSSELAQSCSDSASKWSDLMCDHLAQKYPPPHQLQAHLRRFYHQNPNDWFIVLRHSCIPRVSKDPINLSEKVIRRTVIFNHFDSLTPANY